MAKSHGILALGAVALAISAIAASITPHAAFAQTTIPDLRGTWKGDSESIVLGGGNAHHSAAAQEPELRSVPFTLTVDKQDGRRLSGTFSSPRSSSKVVAVISRSGTLLLADAEGFSLGTMLAPDRMDLCYLKHSPEARLASCVELTKQP
jgi:hypothetical protein